MLIGGDTMSSPTVHEGLAEISDPDGGWTNVLASLRLHQWDRENPARFGNLDTWDGVIRSALDGTPINFFGRGPDLTTLRMPDGRTGKFMPKAGGADGQITGSGKPPFGDL